ncbi:MAG: tRNA preQ1(34) S-adenosylmethionine ribosyltransferase-isomerase QueA, partial [Rickettsiaceae bacterium]|nr:tRNA preQ1(34) S-adenosylmethionine ribosyltransferase-isomerase QueA [Rickettsiaceae bacterium]
MQLSDFDFDLPETLIAQEPTSIREHSNLLIAAANPEIVGFYNLPEYLVAGDLLVFNNSRVINAKLVIHKNDKEININLNRPIGDNRWLGFARPSRRLDEGDEFNFGTHKLKIKKKLEFGEIEVEFCLNGLDLFDFLDQYGQVPLPQYIKRVKSKEEDVQRYQNVYSQPKGSVAAATAGLHFSHDLIEKIVAKNIEIAFVTLHVGAGTFLPVKTENIADHKMHSEWCEVSQETADKINNAKKDGRRVIVVGTTAMRTLESCSENNIVFARSKETSIFITPGYKFQIADVLITNFHLPKSTLFMLVCAFAGY